MHARTVPVDVMKDEVQKTHYDGCWEHHKECAVLAYAMATGRVLKLASKEDRPRMALSGLKTLYEKYTSGEIDGGLFADAAGEILSRAK